MSEENNLFKPVAQEKPLSLQANAKAPRALTARNRSFLQHIASGRPTLEAYTLAGYKGDNHAAYQLRSDLKVHLAELLEQGGFSRSQLAVEVNRLNELPLDPAIRNVNFRQKMDILRLMHNALPKDQQATRPVITPFKISFGAKEAPQVTSIEGEVVSEDITPKEDNE